MKTADFEKLIQKDSADLYGFAYILIPDDLQASQLMIDSLQAFLIQKKNLIEKWLASEKREDIGSEVLIYLYQSLFELSKKRYHQLKLSLMNVDDSGGFFSLELDEKAVLYLKERTSLSLESIEFVTSKNRLEVLNLMYSSRMKMIKKREEISTYQG